MKVIRGFWEYRLIRRVFGTIVQLAYYLLAAVQAPILLCLETLLTSENRIKMWRSVSRFNSQILFLLWGLRIQKVDGREGEGPFVYACNHPSAFDGFTCFGLVGPNVTMLTGPRKMFPYPFNFWFKKSGAIDVMRDWYDDEHFDGTDSLPIPEAIDVLIERLGAGESVFLFVEGHVERSGRLQYVHTGAARIAIRAKVSVVPVTLIGEQKLISRHEMRPGKLKVVFGKPIEPPKISQTNPFRHAVKTYRDLMWEKMREQLPHKYQRPLFGYGCREDVGVFVDIDNTIYKGYSMKDFFVWLEKKGKISRDASWKIRVAVLMNALKLTAHRQMMEQIALVFAGWKTGELKRLAKEFYAEFAHRKYNHHILGFMKDHQECDHTIVLVSESIQPLAECFKELVGAKHAFGSVLESKRGVYTGKIKRLMRDEQKRACAKEFAQEHDIDLSESFAYADSMSDLPIFKLVGHPVVVDPHDRMLFTIAQKRRWEVVR